MKKAVFILQPTTQNGIKGYIVKGWENVLKKEELPKEYFYKAPTFFAMEKKIVIGYLFGAFPMQVQIIKDDFLSKYEWEKSYQLMLQAGHRLGEILKEQRKPKTIRMEI
jgi:hypothetical protein